MNEPLTLKFHIYHPSELSAGLRAMHEDIAVVVASGDVDSKEFIAYMIEVLSDYYDGAKVTLQSERRGL